MHLTNRNIAALITALLAGGALWLLPDHISGKNALFGMNATLLPALSLLLMLGLSLIDLLMSLAARSTNKAQESDVTIGWAAIFGLVFVTLFACAFTFALPWLGFLPSAMAVLIALMLVTGGRNLLLIAAISVLVVAILYIGLHYGLGVHLQKWPDLTMWMG